MNMYLSDLIKEDTEKFKRICKSYKIDKFYAFGSAVTNEFDIEKSDIDLLMKFDIQNRLEKGEALMLLWDELESYFDKKVDLLTVDTLRSPYFKKKKY